MYPDEIEKYINDRNGALHGEEILFITDIRQHPQLNHIVFHSKDNSYEMWDKYGNYYQFKVTNRQN